MAGSEGQHPSKIRRSWPCLSGRPEERQWKGIPYTNEVKIIPMLCFSEEGVNALSSFSPFVSHPHQHTTTCRFQSVSSCSRRSNYCRGKCPLNSFTTGFVYRSAEGAIPGTGCSFRTNAYTVPESGKCYRYSSKQVNSLWVDGADFTLFTIAMPLERLLIILQASITFFRCCQ